ncbi:MAG: fasciclin domain-containing protein [Candidatus Saccharibacteria bacterium]|nr:fasciclin domain-containing protein [Candidatus Saccharibacteria bacterium]
MESSKKSTGLIIGIVLLLLVVGGAALMMNNDDETVNQETTSQTDQSDQTAETQPSNIVGLASETASLSTLVTAVQAADLVETLQSKGPFTVFAPTNTAFSALPAGTLDTLLKPENKSQLSSILTYHVVPAKAMSSDLTNGQEITTVQGEKLTVKITGSTVYIVDAKGNEARVEQADIEASNGVVHVISNVLLPS